MLQTSFVHQFVAFVCWLPVLVGRFFRFHIEEDIGRFL